MATVTLELKSYADKLGLQQLQIVLREGRQRQCIPTEVKIKKTQWQQRSQRVTAHPMAQQLNNALDVRLAQLRAQIAIGQLQAGTVDLGAIAGVTIKSITAYDYGRQCIKRWEGRKKSSTSRMDLCHWNLLHQYDARVTLPGITAKWLDKYDAWLRTQDIGNAGIRKRMDWISKLVNEALREGLLEKNPFRQYVKPRAKEGATVWLTLDEVTAIRQLATTSPDALISRVCWWFCLSCYTGLRFGDVRKFGPQYIQEGRIILDTDKTGEVVSLRIFPALQQCLDAVATLAPVPADPNQVLKVVAGQLGIKKRLHFHVGRHTFATNSLILGATMDVVQKMLGHSKIEQTARYGKIINQVVDRAMASWVDVA